LKNKNNRNNKKINRLFLFYQRNHLLAYKIKVEVPLEVLFLLKNRIKMNKDQKLKKLKVILIKVKLIKNKI